MRQGYLVTEEIKGSHHDPKFSGIDLLVDDLLYWDEDSQSWWKECPGLTMGGFVLTPDQVSTLELVEFSNDGLRYTIKKPKYYIMAWSDKHKNEFPLGQDTPLPSRAMIISVGASWLKRYPDDIVMLVRVDE